MPEQLMENSLLETTKQNLHDYFRTHDVKYIAEDAVYRNLSSGEVYTGRAEIGAMLHFMYNVVFDARAVSFNEVITEEHALFEGWFRGKHIGDLALIKATYNEVEVPLSVSYDLENGLIREARIYMLTEVLYRQLGVNQL